MLNIANTLKQVAGEKTDQIGLIEAKTGKSITFGDLDSRSNSYAAYFKSEGIRAGDIVILMVTPSAEFICLTFALFKIGAPVVLIDPGMGYKNLLRCIDRVHPGVLIGIPKALLFKKIFPRPFRIVRKSFCCGNSFGLLGPDIRRAISESTEPFPLFKPAAEDLAAIIFTTGSTGPPKGVRYGHAVFSAQLRLIRDYYKICSDDIDQPAFPLFALFSTSLGACSVIPDMDPTRPADVDPAKFVDSINKYGVTYSFGSPAIWNVVSRYCIEREIVLKSITKILMAGAPVPYDLLKRVTKILPADAEIHTPYGATESLPVASITGREILTETWEKSKVGKGTCVGRSLPGIEIRIVEISDQPIREYKREYELAPGSIGEIVVKGDVVTGSYENNPDETRLAKIKDGKEFWHRMGDVGYLDDQGRLWFCGRKAHQVKLPDGTLYTIPCEAVINEHQDVYRSALVGCFFKDDSYQTPVIIVEPYKDHKVDPSTLLEEVKLLALSNDLTRNISHFLIHDDFPVDIRHNAKIFREKLSLWAQKKLAGQI